MNTDFLKLFVNVAETHNFSLTAKLTNRTQSAVSQAIKSLEKELGFKLFYRDNKEVKLTSSGEIFYYRIRLLLNNLDSIITESKNLGKTNRGMIRIGMVGTPFENKVIPELIGRYHQNNPNVNIEFENINNNRLKERLSNRECDLIFSTEDDATNIKGIEFTRLLKGRFVAVVPLLDDLSEKEMINFDDLEGKRVFLMTRSWCSPLQYELNLKLISNVENCKFTQVNVVSAADMMTEAQLGIEITNNLVCNSKYENCKVIPLQDSTKLSYGISKLKNYQSPLVENFLNFAKKEDLNRFIYI